MKVNLNLRSLPDQVLSLDATGLDIHCFGEVAVLTGVQRARIQIPSGKIVFQQIVITSIFRNFLDGWRMVLSHAMNLTAYR
jgi:ketosteroid isomerase-like protein